MCAQCGNSQTEQIRMALYCLGRAFDGDNLVSSKESMQQIDSYIKGAVCRKWRRASPGLYVKAARSMQRYQQLVVKSYANRSKNEDLKRLI